jgi:hypothetical protein
MIDYKDLSPNIRVLALMRAKEKEAQIEGKKYRGTSEPQIEEYAKKLGDEGLNTEIISSSLKDFWNDGTLSLTDDPKGKPPSEIYYVLSIRGAPSVDETLKNIGWLKEVLTVQP